VTRDRYSLGEIVIASAYRYPDGTEREGDSHRVALGPGATRAIGRIWDMLIEEVLRVQDELPRSVALTVDPEGMDGWQDKVMTVVQLVAHELHVPLQA